MSLAAVAPRSALYHCFEERTCTPSSDGNQLFMVILENTIGICLQVNFWLYLFSFLIELLFKFSIVLGYLEKSMSQQGVYDVVDRYSAYLTYFFYLLLL